MISGKQCRAPQDTIARIMGMSITGSMSTMRCVYMQRVRLIFRDPQRQNKVIFSDIFQNLFWNQNMKDYKQPGG